MGEKGHETKERMNMIWGKGLEDGRKAMEYVFKHPQYTHRLGARLTDYTPDDEMIQNYMDKSGITFVDMAEKKMYAVGFIHACEQGWPPVDM